MRKFKMNVGTDNSNNSQKGSFNLRNKLIPLFIISLLLFSSGVALAHCDTMDGPLVKDAQKAIRENNVNIVLKWIPAKDEAELKDAFAQVMKVRILSPDGEKLADKSFFETLVRIHRAGEGVAFTGVKPSGTPIDKKVQAADKSIEVGNLSPFEGLISKEEKEHLSELFNKVLSLRNYDVNDVKAGRKYIEAYVHFFKFAEGEGHEEHGDAKATEVNGCGHTDAGTGGELTSCNHIAHLPWILSGLFFITSIVFASLYLKKKK